MVDLVKVSIVWMSSGSVFVHKKGQRSVVSSLQNKLTISQGCFLTLILSTVEHLVLNLLEFLEFLVEFFQNLLVFLFKIA